MSKARLVAMRLNLKCRWKYPTNPKKKTIEDLAVNKRRYGLLC